MMIGTLLRAPQAPADLEPVEPRHHHVQDDEVERLLGEPRERLASVRRPDHLVAVLLQRVAQRASGCLLVIGEQDAWCAISHRDEGYARGAVVLCTLLDPRLYRAALAPVLLALILAAFSLEDRPRPIRSTLAPDAFVAQRASRDLKEMARRFPNRRPGDAADEALARRVARELGDAAGRRAEAVHGAHGSRRRRDDRRRSHAGERDRATSGRSRRPDRRRRPSRRGEAALGRGALGRRRRSSSSRRVLASAERRGARSRSCRPAAASGGAAGARALAGQLGGGPVDAVLVLGDMASAHVHKPWVVSCSNACGVAPVQLTRTVQDAVASGRAATPAGRAR